MLNQGTESPIALFHLAPHSAKALSAMHEHFCGKDAYLAKVILEDKRFTLEWCITGPKKDARIRGSCKTKLKNCSKLLLDTSFGKI